MSRIIRTGKTRMTKRLHCQTIFVSRMEESQTTESSRLSLLEHIMNLLSTTMHSTRTKSILLCSLLLGLVCIANPAYADKPTVKFNKGVQGNSGKGAKSNSGKGTKPHGSQSRGSNGFTFSTKSVPSHSSKSHYRPTTQKSNSVSGHLFDRRRHSPSVQSFNNHQGHHTHNSNLRSHNSNYRSYPSNYRSHPSHQSTEHLTVWRWLELQHLRRKVWRNLDLLPTDVQSIRFDKLSVQLTLHLSVLLKSQSTIDSAQLSSDVLATAAYPWF